MKNIILSIILILVLSLTMAFAANEEQDTISGEPVEVVAEVVDVSGEDAIEAETVEDSNIATSNEQESGQHITSEASSNTEDLTGTTSFQYGPFIAVIAVVIIVAIVAFLSKND